MTVWAPARKRLGTRPWICLKAQLLLQCDNTRELLHQIDVRAWMLCLRAQTIWSQPKLMGKAGAIFQRANVEGFGQRGAEVRK